MADIKKLLDDEIKEEILGLAALPDGSDAKATAIDGIVKLRRSQIEEIEAEAACKEKDKQHKSAIIGICVNAGIAIVSTVGGWLCYNHWYKRGLKFEETGTITSSHTRGLLSRLLPKK